MKRANGDIKKNHFLVKSKTILGVLLLVFSVILTGAFISYLLNWKADQSQAGYMLDKSIKSSNVLGKLGDWLGNLFIFESIGVAAFIIPFLFMVFGLRLFSIRYFKPWKTISHSLFFICWLPIFIGSITKGSSVMSGVYGYQIYEYASTIIGGIGLWISILLSIFIYFILEFNISPDNISEKYEQLKEKIPQPKFEFSSKDEKDIIEEQEEQKEEIKIEEELNNEANVTSFKEKMPKIMVEIPTEPILSEVDKREVMKFEEIEEENIEVEIEKPKEDVPIIDNTEKTAHDLVSIHGFYDHKLELANFQLPSIDLLKDYGNEEITINKEELEANKNKIVALI